MNRNAQLSRLTIADRNRQAIAVRNGERMRERAAMWERIAGRALFAIGIALTVALFYSLTA